jgi:hypothetical protein
VKTSNVTNTCIYIYIYIYIRQQNNVSECWNTTPLLDIFETNNRKLKRRENYDSIDRSAGKLKLVHVQSESLMARKRKPPSVRFDESLARGQHSFQMEAIHLIRAVTFFLLWHWATRNSISEYRTLFHYRCQNGNKTWLLAVIVVRPSYTPCCKHYSFLITSEYKDFKGTCLFSRFPILWHRDLLKEDKTKQTPWPLVGEGTIPTERPPLVDEI